MATACGSYRPLQPYDKDEAVKVPATLPTARRIFQPGFTCFVITLIVILGIGDLLLLLPSTEQSGQGSSFSYGISAIFPTGIHSLTCVTAGIKDTRVWKEHHQA